MKHLVEKDIFSSAAIVEFVGLDLQDRVRKEGAKLIPGYNRKVVSWLFYCQFKNYL